MSPRSVNDWFAPQQSPGLVVRGQIQEAIGALLHVADALVQFFQQSFATDGQSPLVHDNVVKLPGDHPANQQVSFQCWKLVTRIHGHSPRTDDRGPEEQRRLHPGQTWFGKLRPRAARTLYQLARVGAAVRNDWPAVVPARPDDVELVPALRTMVDLPELASLRMNRQAERIANTQRVNLRLIPRLADERIVRRSGPIVVESQDLAGVAARILRLLCGPDTIGPTVRPVAEWHSDRHEDLAVGREHHSRDAEAVRPRIRHEEIFDVGQGVAAVETAPGQHRCPRWTFSALSRVGNVLVRVRLQVREVDQPVLGKAWMQRDVPEAKPARGSSDDRWRVADRLRVEHAVVHNP